MSVKIYYNPRCSKCRIGKDFLEGYMQSFEVIKYLDDAPFTVSSLTELLNKMGVRPAEVLRHNEQEYKELIKGKTLTDEELIAIMVAHPKVIQRPIVVKDDKAVLARPAENMKTLFE